MDELEFYKEFPIRIKNVTKFPDYDLILIHWIKEDSINEVMVNFMRNCKICDAILAEGYILTKREEKGEYWHLDICIECKDNIITAFTSKGVKQVLLE